MRLYLRAAGLASCRYGNLLVPSLFDLMDDPDTIPKIFGGEVEVTFVDPNLDIVRTQIREWIKVARRDRVVSTVLQFSTKSAGILREAPLIQKKPLESLGTWIKIISVIPMLPLDLLNHFFHFFSQTLQTAWEPMIIIRPSLNLDQVRVVLAHPEGP